MTTSQAQNTLRTDWVDSKNFCMKHGNPGDRYYVMHVATRRGSVFQVESYGYSHCAIENEWVLDSKSYNFPS